MKPLGNLSNWRVDCLLTLFLFLLVIVAARFFYLQVLRHEHFAALANKQHWASQEISAARGEIFSSDSFPLANNQTAYLVYGEPQKIVDIEDTAERISTILASENLKTTSQSSKRISGDDWRQEESKRVSALLSEDLLWVPLAHKVSPETKEKIEELGIGGIGFEEEPKRLYPEGRLAAHILGFVGRNDDGLDQGYYGLEGFYNGDLKGNPGRVVQENDASGAPIPVGGYKKTSALDGRGLKMTIDRYLQFLVESHLTAAVGKYQALGGTVIILEPQTGAVLAMASYPAFDPSDPFAVSSLSDRGDSVGGDASLEPLWKNPAISETYEPGSVLKALTMSAAIDAGTVEPQTTMLDSGPIVVSGYKVDNWDGKHHGEETMIEVLQHSNNIGAAWVGEQLGAKTLRDYFLRFGLGVRAGIDLEGEDTGAVKDLSEWRPIDLVTSAFGQGISVTPLQLALAFSAIVNDGRLMRPFVVSGIIDGEKIIQTKPKVVSQVVSSKSAKIIVEMLTQAVEGGESKFYNLKTHKVAGKTGTAQIPVGGSYDPRKTNATFVGFLPSYPRFVMLTLLKQPSSSVYAAETAVPLWMEIAKELTVYYGIGPDK